ncbi:hypothetical protein DTO282F9_1699 [Paecilomyces variotii]|nr:hypothetical protein DTO282F9_1699 [Paecilomyces variotii]
MDLLQVISAPGPQQSNTNRHMARIVAARQKEMSIVSCIAHINQRYSLLDFLSIQLFISDIPERTKLLEMGSHMLELPPLVPEQLAWHASETDPTIWQRQAIGAECVVGMEIPNKMGANDLYLLSRFQLHHPEVTLKSLKEKLQASLLKIRFEHPEIASTVTWKDGNTWIQYRSPKDAADAQKWAEQRIRVEASSRTALDIRTALEEQREVGSGPAEAVTIYVAAPVADETTSLGDTAIELVLYANHVFLDGISVRVLLGDIFRTLASELSTTEPGKLPWGEERNNLDAPLLSLLDPSQEIAGRKFEATRMGLMGNIPRMSGSWGLKTRSENVGLPRSIFHTFTVAETAKLLRAVKERLGPKYTVTHLGHAAVFLALLKTNPPPADAPETFCTTAMPVNSRRFLREDYAKATKTYYPVCQSSALLLFEDIQSYAPRDCDKEQLREKISRAAKHTKESYDFWMNQPSLLPASISFMSLISTALANNQQVPASTPMFTSDGINERFIPREVPNPITQEKAITVQNVRFLLNQYMPFMSLRLDSFRDRCEVSLSYNETTYSNEDAESFLSETVNLMLAFAE